MDKQRLNSIVQQMRGEQWRDPDEGTFDSTMIWYGPGGVEGDCASEFEYESGDWKFSSYQDVEGYFDEYDENFPFLKTTVRFDNKDLNAALRSLGIKVPKSNSKLALYAADYGQAALAYYGGTDEMVEDLPR
jgi:hypothetical protein